MIYDLGFMILGGVLVAVGVAWGRWRKSKNKSASKSKGGFAVLGPLAARAALRVDEGNPLWCVVQQTIAQQIEAAHGELGDVENQAKPQLLSYYAGGARALELLRDFLVSEREAALAEGEEE